MIHPVVASFLQVSDSLNRDLERFGLERRQKPVADLATYLAQRTGEKGSEPGRQASS